MPRHFYLRPRIALPRLDAIEACRTALIWICGAIEFALLFALIGGGIWLYTIK